MPAKKGKPQARGLARQDQILDAAFEMFATDGVRATSIVAVARRAGLSEAGLLHHFRSKDALLLAVLDRADASYPDAEGWIIEGGGGLESLRRFPASAQVLADRPMLARLRAIVSAEAVVADGAARRYVRHRNELIRRLLVALLVRAKRNDDVRPGVDPTTCATQILSFTEGIQIQWMLTPDKIDLFDAYNTYFAGLIDHIATPSR